MIDHQDTKPIVLIGAGGHASVLAEILLAQGRVIRALISPDEPEHRAVFQGIEKLTNDRDIKQFHPNDIELVNGVGMLPGSQSRQEINQFFSALGYRFTSVICESAKISSFAKLHEGCQVLSGATIQAGAVVEDHSIINSGALVEHDCHVGAYNHIAPNAVLCGQVRTENSVFVGANATILPSLCLAQDSIVGAGTVINQNLQAGQIAYPAKAYIASPQGK